MNTLLSDKQRSLLQIGIVPANANAIPVSNVSEKLRLKRLADRGFVRRERFVDDAVYYRTTELGMKVLNNV